MPISKPPGTSREIITFLLTGSDWRIMFKTKFPISSRTPTGAHPHVAHADGVRVSPFHEDGAAWAARSDRDEALEPRDRESLVLAVAEKIPRVHAHLTGRKISHVREKNVCWTRASNAFRFSQLIWHELAKIVSNLIGLFAIVSNSRRLVFPPAEHDLVHGTRFALPVGQRDVPVALSFHVDQHRAASHGMKLVL